MPATLQKIDEDLFHESTMTFGEHLEELRRCLFRALIGLGVGVLFGLLIGGRVIDLIKSPLTKALDQYKTNAAVVRIDDEIERRRAGGEEISDAYKTEMLSTMQEKGLVFDDVYLDAGQLAGVLQRKHLGRAVDAVPATSAKGPNLVAVRIWRQVAADPGGRIIGDNVPEAFMVFLKASFVTGLVISSPWLFWQLWMFVAAGLYPHEKRYVHVFLPFSLGLFLFGASFAFFLVFEPVLNFLLSFNAWLGIDPYLSINAWLSFVLILPLGFGISFQLPLVMLFLDRIGIFDAAAYLANLRLAILAISIISMILTPSDPYSMVLMAVPLVVLYLFGILLCRYWPRRASPLEASY